MWKGQWNAAHTHTHTHHITPHTCSHSHTHTHTHTSHYTPHTRSHSHTCIRKQLLQGFSVEVGREAKTMEKAMASVQQQEDVLLVSVSIIYYCM